MAKIIFWGRPDKGRLQLENPVAFHEYIAGLNPKKRYGLQLRTEKELDGKTNPQLRYFNGVICRMLSEESGLSLEEVKIGLKANSQPEQYLKTKHRGVVTYYKSCADMTKEEMTKLIEDSLQYAAENYNLVIPGPDDHKWRGYGPTDE